MLSFVIELIIALALTAIAIGLLTQRSRVRPRHGGFDLLLIGFGLVAFASWLDVSNLSAAYAASPAIQQILVALELVVGYLLGILLVSAGLISWISALTAYQTETEARRSAEEQLLTAQRRLALHVQHTPMGVIEWDPGFRVRAWNPAAERIFGYTAGEAIGRPATFLMPDHETPGVEEDQRRVGETFETVRHRNVNVRKHGSEIVCEWFNTRLIDAKGALVGYASLVQDVTPRVEAERALEAEKTQVQGLLDSAPGIFYIFDATGRLLRWNRRFETLLGYTEEEIRSVRVLDLVDARDKELAVKEIERAFREGVASTALHIVAKDGRSSRFFATAASVDTPEGKALAGIAIDLSDRAAPANMLLGEGRIADQHGR